MNHIIYIIGFMGSGKTTAGRKLASNLNWSFIDLDKKIEEITGQTIPEIFSMHGEEYFRSVESGILKSLKSETNTVISTGGGSPCYGDNMDHMLESGLTIYLKMTPLQLKKRLTDAKTERPLIKNLKNEELLRFIEDKLAIREKCYERAGIVIEGSSLNINLLCQHVRSALLI
jgi:shikimate kinase